MSNNIELRDYQSSAYNDIRKAFTNGSRGVCCVLPCRSGKSFVMAQIAGDAVAKGSKVLILAHRNELIKQHKKLLSKLNVTGVRVNSVFTEVKRLGEYDKPDLIIIDEAHLSEANSYRRCCEYYGCRVIGFTATPARLDGKPLSLYDTLVTGVSATYLQSIGDIAEYDYYAPDIGINLDNVDTIAGEYNNKQLSSVMCQNSIYGDILKYYNELSEHRQAIAYCTSVKHSQAVCKLFNDNGISAVHIDGKMPKFKRNANMELFKNGKATILCNCNIISEGITLPNASVCLLLRPTQSLPLFIQQSCRVLTPLDGKRAVIIDFVNNIQRHGFPTDSHEWSLLEPLSKRKQSNDNGEFTIRQCPNCFKCFATAQKCPYCGYIYEIKGRELKQIDDAKLKKITAEELERDKQERKNKRCEVGRCTTYADLWQIAHERGYQSGWVYKMAQLKHIER